MESGNMSTRSKDFGGGEELRKEPVTFTLHGEKFECYPEMPGAAMLQFFKDAADIASADAILDFMERSLIPDDWPRFQQLVNDPDRVVRLDKLGEIVAWLVEEYAGQVPTEPSKASSSGRKNQRSGSTVSSLRGA
jgi:hypothetical protein